MTAGNVPPAHTLSRLEIIVKIKNYCKDAKLLFRLLASLVMVQLNTSDAARESHRPKYLKISENICILVQQFFLQMASRENNIIMDSDPFGYPIVKITKLND